MKVQNLKIKMENYNLKFKILTPFLFCFLFCIEAQAAQINFEPPPSSYQVGDNFTLSLVLDTEGESINAVELKILVPKLLRIKSISKNGSAIQLWVSEPSFSGDTISLAGGIPGGFSGPKGLIAKINLEAAAVGDGNIALSSESSLLLNDGQGTKLDLKAAGGPAFKVVPKPKGETEKQPAKSNEQEKVSKEDKRKPESFKILFGKDPRVFEEEPFLSFFTTDQDSGVEHYEVKLGKSPFKIGQSPYLLKDLPARTVIRVRAYDTAGNYTESIYPGFFKRIWWKLITVVKFFDTIK